MKELNKILKNIRIKRNLSIKEMAKGVGVSPSTIINWEKKEVNLRYEHIFAYIL